MRRAWRPAQPLAPELGASPLAEPRWRGDDALMAPDANVNLMHTLGQADVKREPDGLGSVVDENSADRHTTLLELRYTANVYGTTGPSNR